MAKSEQLTSEISTVKLSKRTKERLLKLKTYKNETFEEIIEKMLNIFNLCKQNPQSAKDALAALDTQRKISMPSA